MHQLSIERPSPEGFGGGNEGVGGSRVEARVIMGVKGFLFPASAPGSDFHLRRLYPSSSKSVRMLFAGRGYPY